MSYFEKLLTKRNISQADIRFLWELRLTNPEYSELKETLRDDALDNRFSDTKSAALYYAEWWRREYKGGHVRKTDPCKSLLGDIKLGDQLYDAAIRGAEELNLQFIRLINTHRRYSLFFQGGLPMNCIVNDILTNGNYGWQAFVRNLVWNQQDFSEVEGLREIAGHSDSMHEFCEKLRIAADNQDPSLQPYYQNELWWNVVVRQFEETKRERRARTPFEVSWAFMFDHRGRIINVGARVSGQSTLSKEFVEENDLVGREFTTISVLVNDKNIYTAEYDQRFYCRKSVEVKFQYNIGDTITLSLNDGEKILSKRILDFESPKVLFCKDDDETRFYLGEPRHLKDYRCRIVTSDDWSAACENLGECTSYVIGDKQVKVFDIADSNNVIILQNNNDNEIKTIDPTGSLCNTFVDYYRSLELQMPTKEHLFAVGPDLDFYKGDENYARLASREDVYFSPIGERSWSNQPPLGEIKARVKLADNEYSEPIHLVNSGDLVINVLSSSRDECIFEVQWEFGSVESDQAERRGDHWVISRSNLISNRYCVLKFRPQHRFGSEFRITLIPPFYDFCIFDQNDNELEPRSIIPLVDINNYRYYINSNSRYRLIFDSDTGNYFEYSNIYNTQDVLVSEKLVDSIVRSRHIAHEGPLGSFFMGGSEQIEQRINSSCLSLPYVRTYINIMDPNDRRSSYTIKPFPLRLACNDNVLTITNVTPALSYSGKILALPFDEPGIKPVELIDNGDNSYILRSEMYSGPYDHWLVYGDRQGYILPISVKTVAPEILEQCEGLVADLNENETTRADKLTEIKECLLNDSMFSESWKKAIKWYKMLPQGCIPGTSVLELVAIADEWTLPIKLALHLWVDALCSPKTVKESLDYLKCSLNDFSEQMSFLWKWCRLPSDEEINELASELFESGKIDLEQCYFGWLLTQPIDMLQANPERVTPDSTVLLNAFVEWIDIIRTETQPIPNLTDPDLNNHGDGLVSNEAINYFNQMVNTNPQIERLPLNDQWISVRHNCDQMFQVMDFGVMPGNEHVRREIRQSVINGLRYKTFAQIEEEQRRQRGRRRRG
jgi:hypothetical protein